MFKIVLIALICSILIIYLKSINSELYTLAIVCSGVIIISFGLVYIQESFKIFNYLIKLSGIDNSIFKVIIKVVSIGYLVQFGAGTIEDMGLKGLAEKLIFVGKLIIFTVSLPIFYSLINTFLEMIK